MKTEDAEGEQAKGLHSMLSRLKCLTICRHMLERSEEVSQIMRPLYTILNAKFNGSHCKITRVYMVY